MFKIGVRRSKNSPEYYRWRLAVIVRFCQGLSSMVENNSTLFK